MDNQAPNNYNNGNYNGGNNYNNGNNGHSGGTLFPVIFCQPVFTDEFEGNYILRIPKTAGKE